MNIKISANQSVTLVESKYSCESKGVRYEEFPDDLFDIKITHGQDSVEHLFGVHIDKSLIEFFKAGQVGAFNTESLSLEVSNAIPLPGNPSYLVSSVTMRDGKTVSMVPAPLLSAGRRLAIQAATAISLGLTSLGAVALVSSHWPHALLSLEPWLACLPCVFGVILVAGTHRLRTARAFPYRPIA